MGLRLVGLWIPIPASPSLGFLCKFASHSEASWPHSVGTVATVSTGLIFFSLSIREKPWRKNPKEVLWLALAGVTHHPRKPVTAVAVYCRLPQPHTWELELKKFISHGFGGQISKGTVLAGSVSSGASLCGCVPTWPYCCACISVVSSYKRSVLLDQAPTLDLI